MTNQNKLIVGGVVVVLLGYYFYNKNKIKNEVLELKKGRPISIPLVATELRADSIQVAQGGNKFSNFAG